MQNTAYAVYNKNFELELQIIMNNCLESTTTPTVCSVNVTSLNDTITGASSTFNDATQKLLNEENQYSAVDNTLQNLFAEHGISESCSDSFNQIVPVASVHFAFLNCIDSVKSNVDSATVAIQDKLNSAINSCDDMVSYNCMHTCIVFEMFSQLSFFENFRSQFRTML